MNPATVDQDVVQLLHRMDEEFIANAKAGNARALVDAFYAEDAHFLPSAHESVRGRKAITRIWQGVIAAGLKDLAIITTHIDVDGEMAYGIGQFHMTVEPPGGPRVDETGKSLVVYRKQNDGSWKAVASMFSSIA